VCVLIGTDLSSGRIDSGAGIIGNFYIAIYQSILDDDISMHINALLFFVDDLFVFILLFFSQRYPRRVEIYR